MTTEHLPDPTFRELLRQHRLAAGLAQEELAEKAGLSARGISDLERGARGYPHPDTVRRLASALDLCADENAVFTRAAPRPVSRPAPPTEAERTPFPRPMTPLIGREQEVVTVSRWLREDGHRLVTLHGPGGMGKTRLALAIAEWTDGDFRDGQGFVDLAPLRDPALIVAQVAAALGLKEHPGQPLQETLAAHLSPRHILIVLDNFEHVLPAAAIVADLLRAAQELHLVVTSRSPLRLQGEHLFQVPPLGVFGEDSDDLATARANDAVTLFVTIAQAVQADFSLTAENAATVLAICRRLEGLPLALELAAARITILPPTTLLARLGAQLPLLTRGARDAPPRHRTLRDAIAWSDALLEPPERAFFHRLGVFVGGWTLEAAEVVAASSTIDALEGLATLADFSLIRVVAGETEPRYAMLETIREFARERLAGASEETSVVRAHAAYYSDLAARAAHHLTGSGQGEWLRQLDAENPNLRAALQTLAADDDGNAHLRCVASLGDFWFRRSHFAEGRGHLEAALARAAAPSLPRAEAMLWVGALAFGQGNYPTADTWLQQCETLALSLNAFRLVYDAFFWRGVVAEQMGDASRAASCFESALAVARDLGEPKGIGSALNALCLLALHRGELVVAEQRGNEAVSHLHAAGDAFELSVGYANLGEIALARGDLASAAHTYQAALVQAINSDVTWLLANVLVGFAALATARGNFLIAAQLLGATDTVRSESLHLKVPSFVLHTETTRRVRTALSDSEFLEAWEIGRALSREEALNVLAQLSPIGGWQDSGQEMEM
jgi:predicted ATPase/DNA-binding XRE family transcriptional regulator